jgi:hypothetical protein
MFKLSRDEVLRISQFVKSSDLKFSKNVYAFTQEGVVDAVTKPMPMREDLTPFGNQKE